MKISIRARDNQIKRSLRKGLSTKEIQDLFKKRKYKIPTYKAIHKWR